MKTYRKNIPDGMRDMVYGEIKTVKEIGEKLLSLYQKRGYVETETNYIKTNYEDYLCYDVMVKELL